jgi:hypothetical protein
MRFYQKDELILQLRNISSEKDQLILQEILFSADQLFETII